MIIFSLRDQPTRAELRSIGATVQDGAIIGQPGTFTVGWDEQAFPPPFPQFINAGVEISIPNPTRSERCWNCSASQPAPGDRTQRQRELETGRVRTRRPDDPGA